MSFGDVWGVFNMRGMGLTLPACGAFWKWSGSKVHLTRIASTIPDTLPVGHARCSTFLVFSLATYGSIWSSGMQWEGVPWLFSIRARHCIHWQGWQMVKCLKNLKAPIYFILFQFHGPSLERGNGTFSTQLQGMALSLETMISSSKRCTAAWRKIGKYWRLLKYRFGSKCLPYASFKMRWDG